MDPYCALYPSIPLPSSPERIMPIARAPIDSAKEVNLYHLVFLRMTVLDKWYLGHKPSGDPSVRLSCSILA
jgi:hypothetical protein